MKPLSPHAIGELRAIAEQPVPCCGVNPGVAKRLLAEALVETVQLPSPFRTHKGRNIEHLQATPAGLAVVAERAQWRLPS